MGTVEYRNLRDAAAAKMRGDTAGPATVTKLTQDAAGYRPSRSCEHCRWYSASGTEDDTGTCQLVSGTIDGDAVCDRYEAAGGTGSSFLGAWS